MSKKIKNWIRKGIPDQVKKFVSYSEEVEYGTVSFSQFGEDMILRNFFLGKRDGFYVDIGAHHPVKFSNTYYFYKLGWNGITIDPLPGVREQFEAIRPRDVFLEIGLSDHVAETHYFRFRNPLQNTFSEQQAATINKELNPLEEKTLIRLRRLDEVLDEHLPPGTGIDFLTIDAEGFDFRILKSNNWKKYRPARILVEDFSYHPAETEPTPIARFLEELDYRIEAYVNQSIFFKDVRIH